MLFQKIYTWIKYRLVTPSFSAKNRLFIERDTKMKRIFANFHLMFENGKWTFFARKQTNHSFIRQLLFVFLITSITTLYLYYQFSIQNALHITFTAVNYMFWVSKDAFNYTTFFLVWTTLTFIALMRRAFFFFFVPLTASDLGFFNWFIEDLLRDSRESLPTPSTHMARLLQFSDRVSLIWNLSMSDLNQYRHRQTLPHLFENVKLVDTTPLIFKFVYKLQNQIAKESKLVNTTLRNQMLDHDSLFRNIFQFNFKNFSWIQQILQFVRNNEIMKTKLHMQLSNPNLSTLNFQFNVLSNLFKNFKLTNHEFSAFSISSMSQPSLIDERNIQFFQNLISKNDQLMTKIRRWSYHYSILHRKTNYILTSVSKTFQFMNSMNNLIPNPRFNLWDSEKFGNVESSFSSRILTEMFNMRSNSQQQYFNFNEQFHNIQQFKDNSLPSTIPSLIWFVKRFSFFSSLNNDNTINTMLKSQSHDNSTRIKRVMEENLKSLSHKTNFLSPNPFFEISNFKLKSIDVITPLLNNESNESNESIFLELGSSAIFTVTDIEFISALFTPISHVLPTSIFPSLNHLTLNFSSKW